MFNAFISPIIGSLSVIFYFLNTLFWIVPIVLLSFIKVIPWQAWQRLISYPLDACATNWISVNSAIQAVFSRTKIKVSGLEELTLDDWYLVISNHQSWVDILVLQRIFNRKIPFLKFFLKQELIWVPFLGIAWWALDFPFMRRYSKSYLAKNPHMKGKDMETTRKACEKFRTKPVSVMNFVEGTRFDEQKKKKQNSAFEHLLRPKAGGIAFVLSAMGEQLNKVVDVTIYYPEGVPTFWDFACGRVNNVQVKVRTHSIATLFEEKTFSMEYFTDAKQRARFHTWLNSVWVDKNDQLKLMHQPPGDE